MTRKYNGFRLIDGTIDNSKCPHLHFVDDGTIIRCQTCGHWLCDRGEDIDDGFSEEVSE